LVRGGRMRCIRLWLIDCHIHGKPVFISGRARGALSFRFEPFPISDFRQILAVDVDVLPVLDQLVLELLLQIHAGSARLGQAIDRVHREMETV
jgi:hypothetical protein